MKYAFDQFSPTDVALRRGYPHRRRWDVLLSYDGSCLCYDPYSGKSRFALGDLKRLLGVPDRYQMYASGHVYSSPSGSRELDLNFPSRSVYWKVDAQTYLRLHSDPTPLAQIVLGILPPLDVIDLLGD